MDASFCSAAGDDLVKHDGEDDHYPVFSSQGVECNI